MRDVRLWEMHAHERCIPERYTPERYTPERYTPILCTADKLSASRVIIV
jgi:hypothetical protein